jgi:hypothetical protein
MWSWPISKYWPSNRVEWIAKIQNLLTEVSIPVMVWNLLSFNICPLKSTDHYDITHVLDSGTDCYCCMYQVLTATCEASELNLHTDKQKCFTKLIYFFNLLINLRFCLVHFSQREMLSVQWINSNSHPSHPPLQKHASIFELRSGRSETDLRKIVPVPMWPEARK